MIKIKMINRIKAQINYKDIQTNMLNLQNTITMTMKQFIKTN